MHARSQIGKTQRPRQGFPARGVVTSATSGQVCGKRKRLCSLSLYCRPVMPCRLPRNLNDYFAFLSVTGRVRRGSPLVIVPSKSSPFLASSYSTLVPRTTRGPVFTVPVHFAVSPITVHFPACVTEPPRTDCTSEVNVPSGLNTTSR